MKEALEKADFANGRSAQDCLIGNDGEEDRFLVALEGSGCLLVYSFLGNAVRIAENRLDFTSERAYWLNPKTGSLTCVELSGDGIYTPPQGEGLQDFVLVLAAKDAAERFEVLL